MRALLLAVVLSLGPLGLTLGAPTQARAQVPVDGVTVQPVEWHGWHRGWRGNYRPYYRGYYRPYWGGYYGGWYYPGYNSYYYGAYPYASYYHGPGFSIWWLARLMQFTRPVPGPKG
jgi:hypothetical protein